GRRYAFSRGAVAGHGRHGEAVVEVDIAEGDGVPECSGHDRSPDGGGEPDGVRARRGL
ncbi:MAG: hypothetical protein AVDCRST_MAG53-1074, partial [uncultured Solirubrobacteraceae bacterium]